ncbi:hypothetical protein A4X13_0g4336 [Tilletia indica]|uniref:Uncharacterized protein n=1 Tax=Tilletia indica TaxID=43049 RepID=A0A177TC64_9BASI|nr:hypothetical protein A4X13_0g4336 [Tilletia indica]
MAGKNSKWPTHLNLSGELILGKSASKDNVNEVSTTMYSHDGQEHAASLNVWGRDPPEQGTYLLTNIPFATTPLRLGVGDAAEMRLVPDEFDGIESDLPSLPPTFIFLSGIGVIGAVDADRKGCTVSGFTYLNKKHGWQKYALRLEFEDTARWAAWTVPGSRSLVTFDAIMVEHGYDGFYKCYIRRITSIHDADRGLLLALNIGSPGGGDRAERLRQARAAKAAADTKGKAKESEEPDHRKTRGEGSGSRAREEDADEKEAEPEEPEAASSAEGKDEDEPVTPPARKVRRTGSK